MNGTENNLPTTRFGHNPSMQDELAQLILLGIKTVSCSALCHYRKGGEVKPKIGQLYQLLNGAGRAIAVIKITTLEERRFCHIDAAFAQAEGEGDLSLDDWRRTHCAFFTRKGVLDNRMELLCEYFELVSTQ